MFNFRIINTADGNQIIDKNLKTPYKALTPSKMVEYMEIDKQLVYMDRIKRKAETEAERKWKLVRNLIYKMACLCGLV